MHRDGQERQELVKVFLDGSSPVEHAKGILRILWFFNYFVFKNDDSISTNDDINRLLKNNREN